MAAWSPRTSVVIVVERLTVLTVEAQPLRVGGGMVRMFHVAVAVISVSTTAPSPFDS